MNFITVDEYKAALNITSPKQDPEFTILINSINQFITDYLGYSEGGIFSETLYVESSTETLDRIWKNIISVKTSDNLELPFKLIKGYILQIEKDYIGNVILEGELVANTTNDALKHAAFLLVQYYIKDQYMQSISSSNGGGSISLPSFTSVPVHIKSILDIYRIS